MAKKQTRKGAADEGPDPSEVSAATPPPRSAQRPYEGGEPKSNPDTGEPQGVDDPLGDRAREGDEPDDLADEPGTHTAEVSVPGTSLKTVTVSFDVPEGGDEKATEEAAVEAYKRKTGIWSLPKAAVVGKPARKPARKSARKGGE